MGTLQNKRLKFASSRFQQGGGGLLHLQRSNRKHTGLAFRPAASLTLDLAQMAFGHLRIKTLCCMGFSAPTTRSAPPGPPHPVRPTPGGTSGAEYGFPEDL